MLTVIHHVNDYTDIVKYDGDFDREPAIRSQISKKIFALTVTKFKDIF